MGRTWIISRLLNNLVFHISKAVLVEKFVSLSVLKNTSTSICFNLNKIKSYQTTKIVILVSKLHQLDLLSEKISGSLSSRTNQFNQPKLSTNRIVSYVYMYSYSQVECYLTDCFYSSYYYICSIASLFN